MDISAGLCRGAYWATRCGDVITLHAVGCHRTAGYQVHFDGKPPEFTFYHVAPNFALPVITPFCYSIKFPADSIEFVIVHDATGTHKIPVEKVPECVGTPSPEVMRSQAGPDKEKD